MVARDPQRLLPPPVGALPADLAVAVSLVILTDLAALLPIVRETPLRVILGLPLVLFVPGYVLVAALFPAAGDPPEGTGEAGGRRSIDGTERVALSFATSIAITPLLGLVLNVTPVGIRLVPVLLALSAFTLVAVGVAAVRRWALPPEERFAVTFSAWLTVGRAELLDPESRIDATVNIVMVASLVLAAASVGYAVAIPQQDEALTEFYLLTRGAGDELVAADYPTEFVAGEATPLVVGIGNHEHETVDYDVVVVLQRVAVVGNNTTRMVEERELDRFGVTVAPNETWTTDYEVQPTMTGERLRLAFLLYRTGVPPEPTMANAYRSAHLWVNVTGSASGRK